MDNNYAGGGGGFYGGASSSAAYGAGGGSGFVFNQTSSLCALPAGFWLAGASTSPGQRAGEGKAAITAITVSPPPQGQKSGCRCFRRSSAKVLFFILFVPLGSLPFHQLLNPSFHIFIF
jgi:hypothetical protein